MGIVLAMALTAPVVGVQSDGATPCDAKGFARALATLRPELRIIPLDGSSPAPAEAWLARIEGLGFEQATLRISGSPTPIVRSLAAQDCSRALETAASIVDGLLDELPSPALESVRRPTPLPISLSAWLGAGVLQGPIRWVSSFALGVRMGYRSFEVVGAVDLGLPASIPFTTQNEEAGTYQAIPVDLELGAGWGPHLGPGRLSLDGSVGSSLANVSTSSVSAGAPHLGGFQLGAQFFVAASASYTFDLPARFFAGLRVEERLSPARSTVTVEGTAPGDEVLTRTWSFASSAIVGWRFF